MNKKQEKKPFPNGGDTCWGELVLRNVSPGGFRHLSRRSTEYANEHDEGADKKKRGIEGRGVRMRENSQCQRLKG